MSARAGRQTEAGQPVQHELDRERGDRFEINHHPYRMRQSACFLESGSTDAAERLSCLTCHDPHRKVPEPERAAHYRQACQSCHQVDACGLRAMTESKDMLPLHMRGVDPGNCVGCHMPRRRTRDVIHVVMTDHKIQTLPGSAEPDTDLTAPREEFTPTLVDMDFYLPETAPEGDLGQVYQAYGVELIGGNTSSFEHLQRMVASTGTEAEEPRIQLTRAYLIRGLTSYAERTLEGLLEDDPDDTRSLTLQALAKSLRDPKAALTYLERARAVSPFEDPDLYYNLGVIYGHADRPDDALAALERTVELRPLHSAGWMQLGLLQERLGQLEDAERALRRSLATEPTASRARLALARVLMASDQRDEAIRQLRHGWRWGDDPEDLAQALEELGAELEEPVSKIKSTDGPARGTDRRDNRPAQRPGAGSH